MPKDKHTTDPAELERLRLLHAQLLEDQTEQQTEEHPEEQPIDGQLSLLPPLETEGLEPFSGTMTDKEARGRQKMDVLSAYTSRAVNVPRKLGDPPPSRQENPEREEDKVRRGVFLTTAAMDFLKDPVGALSRYHFPATVTEAADLKKYEAQVQRAAEICGGDPEQIRDPKRRTPEQQEALLRAGAEETLRRLTAFFSANYWQVYNSLPDLTEAEPPELETPEDWGATVKSLAVTYFFATHPGSKPTAPASMEPEQLEEAAEILRRLDHFIAEQLAQSRANKEQTPPHVSLLFSMFITAENPERAAEILHVVAAPSDGLHWPLDILSSSLFTGGEIPEGGKVEGIVDATRSRDKAAAARKGETRQPEAVIRYLLDFGDEESNLTFSKQLTQYDKRVMLAAAELYSSGNPIFSASALYRQMGNRSRYDSNAKRKITDSLEKLSTTRITISNEKEASLYNYPLFRHRRYLLNLNVTEAIVNGQLAEAAFELKEEPALLLFARQRGQVTIVPRAILESPLNKTEENLAIEDYIIRRIQRHRRDSAKGKGKGSRSAGANRQPLRILFATIYEHSNVTEKKQKQRAKQRILQLMEHYVKTEFIYEYDDDRDGLTIRL